MLPLREILLNSDQANFKLTTIVAFEEDRLHTILADVNISIKLKNPLSSAKDWLKEKLTLQQSALNVWEKKQLQVNITQGRNLENPNLTSESIEPLVWFKF